MTQQQSEAPSDTLTVPADAKYIGTLMRNLDREVDGAVADKLRTGNYEAAYAAWNFFGHVWWDGAYHCQIMRYHAHIATITADTPEELMEECSNWFGSE